MLLNSDRYGRGKRLFVTARIPLNDAFSILMFATQAIDYAVANVPQQRIDVGFVLQRCVCLAKDAPLLRGEWSHERSDEFYTAVA